MILSILGERPEKISVHTILVDMMRVIRVRTWDSGKKDSILLHSQDHVDPLLHSLWNSGLSFDRNCGKADVAAELMEPLHRAFRSCHYNPRNGILCGSVQLFFAAGTREAAIQKGA